MCFPSPFESIRDIASVIGGSGHPGANRDTSQSTNANRDANDTTTDRTTMKLEKKILKAKLKFEKKEAKQLKKAEKKREKERKKEMNAEKKKMQPPTTDGVSDARSPGQSSESLGSIVGNNSHHHGDCLCRHHGYAGGPGSSDGSNGPQTPVSITH